MTPKEIETGFSGLQEHHRAILSDMRATDELLGNFAVRRDDARARIKSIEANLWVNGGTHDHPIDGKNEKLREAQHQAACDGTKEWVDATEELRKAQSGVEHEERDLALLNRALRGIELGMQFRIEQFQHLNTPRFYRET